MRENPHGVSWGLRLAEGAAISGGVAWLSCRLHALTPSAAWTAAAVGTMLVGGGGWSWLALLATFFATSSFLTRLDPPGNRSSRRSADRGGRRWDQVAANGGIAALAALAYGIIGWPAGFAAAAGAIAAATADTWGTEIGRWSTSEPRLITTWRIVSHGDSGAITALGTAGAAVGAALIASLAAFLAQDAQGHPLFPIVFSGGISGALLDSLLGATLELRYRWMSNSVVNLIATAWGAAVVMVGLH
jgi:uncharacterized protein (TIGR00297 family)